MSDVTTLRRMLGARLTQYEHSHASAMSSSAVAQLLSVTLYYRRFFPYYAFCMIGGLDEEGRGAVYGYDAVGSFKRDDYGCMGSGQNYIMPILDNLVRSQLQKLNYLMFYPTFQCIFTSSVINLFAFFSLLRRLATRTGWTRRSLSLPRKWWPS